MVDAHPSWYHRFEIFPGITTPGVYDPSGTLSMLKLPDRMDGRSVLEIGPADGYFTKAMHDRGASITTLDYASSLSGFSITQKLSGLDVNKVDSNIFDVDKHGFEPFDHVIMLGILYHLPDLVRPFWLLRPLIKGELIIETVVSRKFDDLAYAEYTQGATPNGDMTNFWAPSPKCVEGILLDCGYLITETWLNGERGMFRAVVNDTPKSESKVEFAYSFVEP